MKYYLKPHVTEEMLKAVGFVKALMNHYKFKVNNNHVVLIDKQTHEVKAVKYDFKLLKLVDIESKKLNSLIKLGYVEVRND